MGYWKLDSGSQKPETGDPRPENGARFWKMDPGSGRVGTMRIGLQWPKGPIYVLMTSVDLSIKWTD